jgi:cyclophilin family peptidyl-prolyl cis-trans isomerase/HEAT repeat protein
MLREVVRHDRTLHLGAIGFGFLVLICGGSAFGQSRAHSKASSSIPLKVHLRIVKAEDERRWDNELSGLLADPSPVVRERAALAGGRIGDVDAVASLVSLMQKDNDPSVRTMAAFGLGEIESGTATEALISQLGNESADIRSRAVEALGKIAAAIPKAEESRQKAAGEAILKLLKEEAGRTPAPDTQVLLVGLTAALRARPEGAGNVIAMFLSNPDARVRADAANALARLRSKEGNEQLRRLLTNDLDPVVRANAARVMGATTDKDGFGALVERAKEDEDSRVRVSAIRALAALKDQEPRVAKALGSMWCQRRLLMTGKMLYHQRDAECLELVTALGRVFQGTDDKQIIGRLSQWGLDFRASAPELQMALVRISPWDYLSKLSLGEDGTWNVQGTSLGHWGDAASLAQALGEIANLPETIKDKKQLAEKAESLLRAMLSNPDLGRRDDYHAEYAIPDVLRAFASYKSNDLREVLLRYLRERDVVIRATASELLGELPPEKNVENALVEALPRAMTDQQLNDAALAILDALAKQKTDTAYSAIKSGLESTDYLVRQRAVALLKINASIDNSSRIGTVKTTNTDGDYRRALSRTGKTVLARVNTTKGAFTIELLAEEAPLNVDNFVQLAKRGYFKGISFHRVVPNFVIQGGDPRGDGNGGPGYQIRCEINEVPYERGAVGMALSGKDTGGSQWFVTHSRQPHLDGGYTVFGKVVEGMEIVDSIVRGDVIQSIVVTERSRR